MWNNVQHGGHMKPLKTSRVTVRVTDVVRGKLVEEAGHYGTISNVVRAIVEKYYAKGARK